MTPTVPTPYTQSPEQLILTLIRAGWTQEQIATRQWSATSLRYADVIAACEEAGA